MDCASSGGQAPILNPQELQDQSAVGHKMKGAALLYGFPGLGKLGAMLETVFEEALLIDGSKWPGTVDLIREIVASFRSATRYHQRRRNRR